MDVPQVFLFQIPAYYDLRTQNGPYSGLISLFIGRSVKIFLNLGTLNTGERLSALVILFWSFTYPICVCVCVCLCVCVRNIGRRFRCNEVE